MKMSLRVLYQTQNKLTQVFGLILLCIAYFHDSLIAWPVNKFFQISFIAGQVLVNKFLVICKFTIEAAYLIQAFFQVLYEDSVIFVKDATEKFTYTIYLVKYIYLHFEELGWFCFTGLCEIGEIIHSTIEAFFFTVASLRYGLHFTGSTIWKFFMQIPEALVLKIKAISTLIVNTFRDFISSVCTFYDKFFECLEKIYLFFFDIPLDSVYGLIIGAVLVFILYVKFNDIYKIISNATFKFYKKMINFGISLWTGRFLEKKAEISFGYGPDDDERLCVICQYHVKEIITFPCKHLCLCLDCSSQLTKIKPICPLCRCRIKKTVKVYF